MSTIPNNDLAIANDICDFQSHLMDLTANRIDGFINYFSCLPFNSNTDLTTDMILLAAEYRPNKLDLYVDLFAKLAENSIVQYTNSLLRNFVPMKVKYYFYLAFLQKCYQKKVINETAILEKIKTFLYQYSQEIMPTAYLFLYFAPLVSKEIPEIFDRKCAMFAKQFEDRKMFFEAKIFFSHIQLMKENNWELYWTQSATNYPVNSLQSIIFEDDIDTFQQRSGEKDFDINQEIKIHSYENIAFPEVNPTLLQFAAYYGSSNIFKFVLLNGANLKIKNKEGFSFEHFAIAGGDPEMIHIFEGKGLSFDNTLLVAAQFHQNQIFDWIYESKDRGDLNQVFLNACAANNLYVVLFFLDELKFNVNIVDEDHESPLHYAAKYGANEVLNLLLAHPEIDVNLGKNERTALDVAAISGLCETVRILLTRGSAHGIEFNNLDRNGRTVFCNAIEHFDLVQELLNNQEIDVNLGEKVPIQLAIRNESIPIVKLLLDSHRIDISKLDEDGNTLLHLAMFNNKSDILRLLLNDNRIIAQLNIKNADGNTPLHLAARNKTPEFVSAIFEFLSQHQDIQVDINARNNNQDTSLHLAAKDGVSASISILISHANVDVNAKDELEQTPLHLAARKCNFKQMKELFNSPQIKINQQDMLGNTPLHIAMTNPTADGINLLIEQPNLEFNIKNKKGESPLHLAAKSFHPEFLKSFLINNNIDYFILDNNGQSCFHKAATSSKPTAMKILLDVFLANEQDRTKIINLLNVQDKDGITALHLSGNAKESGPIKALLAVEGININAIDNNLGQTPLHFAVIKGNVKIVDSLLRANGINKNIEDKKGKKPIDLLPNKPTRKQIETLLNK